jgi:hypothetical protein
MDSCLNEVVDELDMLLLLIYTMGIPFCEVVVWIGEVVLRCSCEGPKWTFEIWSCWLSFWCCWMNLTWYNFCFHVVVVLVESFGRKRVFRVRCRCLSVFANKWLCEVWEKWFWDGWNLNFSVDYDRAKCQEHVGENGIEIRLTVWILCAKWWKRKNEEKAVLSIEHGRAVHGTGRANFLYLLARPCPCVARAVRADRTSVSAFFVLFHPFLLWIGLWCKHESFR